ncbi:AAA family ATPase [Periweissella fabalis]|uniref:ATP-binding protein n=1 Tax=Periweissella fabalis TaxID=1070421 RepID=A0A7X6N4J9_9LACO|nr:AAA family ATPase [Periweissella fabalis]NKZ23815.1 ATP-binding protein [Periweissella fabalis]
MLLSYFQNEARKKRQNNGNKFKETIYAVEEPKTALHPHHQKMLIMALKEMSEQEEIQILLTTHSP